MMEELGPGQGFAGREVADILDQLMKYVIECSKYFDHCHDLHHLLSNIKPLVLQSIKSSSVTEVSDIPSSLGAAMWLRKLKPELETAEEQLKKILLGLTKRSRLGLPLDVLAKHKCSRSIRKMTERIRKAVETQAPVANLETTFYTRKLVEKLHDEVTNLSSFLRTSLKVHGNQLFEVKLELAESRLTNLIQTEIGRIGGAESVVNDVKRVLQRAITNEMEKIRDWQQKAIQIVQKQQTIHREDYSSTRRNNFTHRFEQVLSNLNEQTTLRAVQHHHVHGGTGFFHELETAPNSPKPIEFRDVAKEGLQLGPLVSFPLLALTIATANFSKENEVGKGGTSIVYKGVLADGRKIAIKRFLNRSKSKSRAEHFLSELEVHGLCDHPNILKLLGYYSEIKNTATQNPKIPLHAKKENDTQFALIAEYMENKDLADCLFKSGWC